MGFNANPTIYRLEFEDPALEGLVVRVRRGSVQIRYDFDQATTWQGQLECLQQALVEWNLVDDDDEPLPLTVDAMLATEDKVVDAILNGWVQASRPPAPLGQPSTPGTSESEPPQLAETTDLDLEASMPMESPAA